MSNPRLIPINASIAQKRNKNGMQRLFKTIGVVSIVILALAVVAELSAQESYSPKSTDDDHNVCLNALNRERTAWDKDDPRFSYYVTEASRRGLTVDACNQLLAQPVSRPPPESYIGTREQREFLEAAAFFITGLDVNAADGDVVSDNTQINFGKYPVVAYLVKSNPCAGRVRTTTEPYTIWQIDFCKITRYQQKSMYGFRSATWLGYKEALCIKGWYENSNYTGPIDQQNAKCSLFGQAGVEDPDWYGAWDSIFDIGYLIGGHGPGYYSNRSVDRMIASYKYIVTLLSGKPY